MNMRVKKRTSGAGRRTIIAVLESGNKGIDIETLSQKVYGDINKSFVKRLKKLISIINYRYDDIEIRYDRLLKRYYWTRL